MDLSMLKNSEEELCRICEKNKKLYQCPRCNIFYCSVECYKKPVHLACSEQFYKNCIAEQLKGDKKEDNDLEKMVQILKRVNEADFGKTPDFSDDPIDKEIDSDDDVPEEEDNNEDEDEDEDLASRLEGVDLNNAEEVLKRLTSAEIKDFEKMVESGDIMKLLPDYKPWWLEDKRKIVDLSEEKNQCSSNNIMTRPKIAKKIADFSQICQKEPSPSVHYNLWNILASYSCIARFYSGDHLLLSIQAVPQLVDICLHFKFGTNFDSVDDAITSVMMETMSKQTRPDTVPEAQPSIESKEFLLNDAKLLMSSKENKLAALSDILDLLDRSKKELRKPENADIFKLFAVCSGSVELDRQKLIHLIKKVEFLLAYVNHQDSSIG